MAVQSEMETRALVKVGQTSRLLSAWCGKAGLTTSGEQQRRRISAWIQNI
jgi:hypothetical protein